MQKIVKRLEALLSLVAEDFSGDMGTNFPLRVAARARRGAAGSLVGRKV
jgi:hypothetical protein